jgi:hypothetical protein
MNIATSLVLILSLSIAGAQNSSQIQLDCQSCVQEKTFVFIKYVFNAALPAKYTCRPGCTAKASAYSFVVDFACTKESCMEIESRAISRIHSNNDTSCDGELKNVYVAPEVHLLLVFIFIGCMLLLIAVFVLLVWMGGRLRTTGGKKNAALSRLQRWNVEELNELKQTESCNYSCH